MPYAQTPTPINGVLWNPETGGATIALTYGVMIGNRQVFTLTMRCPSLLDMDVMDRLTGSDLDREQATIANWCDISLSDLKTVRWPDYRLRLQPTYLAYLNGTSEALHSPSGSAPL